VADPPAPTDAERLRYRAVIGHLATGVTIVTAMGPDGAVGMTTNAVCSVSLDPVLLLVCFDDTARTLPVVAASGRFGVNILRAGQERLSGQFASKLPVEQKFDAVEYSTDHGVPVLDGVLAWLVCELRELRPGGDHEIAIARVLATGHADEGEPLVWYRGGYTSLKPDAQPG
jgi:3-hydroxy-9,10-secoandrosta-1,3,5(10)-triene-9,17-dione monooxygenase reductase component